MLHISKLFGLMQAGEAPAFGWDAEALSAFAKFYGQEGLEWVILFVPKIIVALIILWIASALSKSVYNSLQKRMVANPKVDSMLGNLAANTVRYAIFIAGLLAAVSVVGVDVAKVFVILSAATLAIGLALQGSMSNVAAGLLLITTRPFKLGDFVELAGQEGVVDDINIFATSLRTVDNVKVIISNAEVRSNTIKNLTSMGVRRVDIDFGIDYGDDMDKAMKVIMKTAAKHDKVLDKPDGPWTRVANLNDSSIDIQLRVWCKAEDYWDVRFDLLKDVKEAFDKSGISIPYPHVVEIVKR